MLRNTIQLGGLPIDRLTQHTALDAIASLIAAQRGGFVVTPNLDHIALARGDQHLRAAYQDAALSLADGQPLVWGSRLLGTPLPERVAGADLLAPLFARAEQEGWRVFLLGGQEDVSRRAKRMLRARHPRLRLVGRDASYWSPRSTALPENEPTVRAVQRARPDVVIVAYGCPKQERWMHRHAAHLGSAVCLGLGGSLDFYVGAVRRAPAWMSRSGIEWMYRLAQEPRRMAVRYLWRDPQVVPALLFDALAQRIGMAPAVPVRDTPRLTHLIPGISQSRGHHARRSA
jgi:N-acetylglucosaminyldiphosphoundecaprenol N-acetyl-beta-D-mannosaminyltransferase